jgi:membrane protease YdiL (CAAX protease family)
VIGKSGYDEREILILNKEGSSMSRSISKLGLIFNQHVWLRLITVVVILEICDDFIVSPLLAHYFGGHFWFVNVTYKSVEFLITLLLNHNILQAKVFIQRPMLRMSMKRLTLILVIGGYFGGTVIFNHSDRFMAALTVGLIAAIPEEYFWRGLILGYFVQQLHGKLENRALWSLILSSLLFGLYHLSNLHVQPLEGTIAQVFQAMGLGMILGAVYLKTGNLLAPILVHFCWDFFVTLVNGISFSSGSPVDWGVTIVISGLLCILGVVILLTSDSHLGLIEKVE